MSEALFNYNKGAFCIIERKNNNKFEKEKNLIYEFIYI